MGNVISLQFGLEGSFLFFMWEAYRTINSASDERSYGRRRSLVRLVGSSLLNRIKLPPRVTIHPTARRSMFKQSSCNRSLSVTDHSFQDGDFNRLSLSAIHAQPDVVSDLYPIFEKEKTPERFRHKSNEKIADLEHKLNELNCLVQQLLAASNNNRETAEPPASLQPAPPPPPPPPLPMFNAAAPQLKIQKKDTKTIPKSGPRPLSMCDVLKDMTKVKLRHVERSPGGRPMNRPKTPVQPADSLAEILRRRFAAIQLSPEVPNCPSTDSDDSDSYKIHLVQRC